MATTFHNTDPSCQTQELQCTGATRNLRFGRYDSRASYRSRPREVMMLIDRAFRWKGATSPNNARLPDGNREATS